MSGYRKAAGAGPGDADRCSETGVPSAAELEPRAC